MIAGIIGVDEFTYALWGDTVNTARRLETQGVERTTQISTDNHALIEDLFFCETRGPIDVKGGPIETWLLVDRKTRDAPPLNERREH